MTGTEQSLQGPCGTPDTEFTSLQSAATLTTYARSSTGAETLEPSTRSTAVATTDDALSYPSAFGQTLGLLQSVVVKADKFPQCWANSKLLQILRQ